MSTVDFGATEVWLRWKHAHEAVRIAVIADVATATTLSEPELTVLVQLSEAGGALRQNVLVASTGWDRSRLSHLLTRMEARGYLVREKIRNGVEVTLRPAGQAMIDDAYPLLETAVRRHFLDKLTNDDRRALNRLLDTILG